MPLRARQLTDLVRAPRLTLLLDIDGTLVPYARRAEEALLDQEGSDLLNTLLANGVQLAVISGRPRVLVEPIHDAVPGLVCVAEHGAWWRTSNGWRCEQVHDDEIEALADQLTDIAGATPGARVERKSISVALHWREVVDDARRELHAVADAVIDDWLATRPHYRRLPGVELTEVVPRTANKGHAVEWVRRNLEPTRFIAIGDDITDEDMFAALDRHDLSIAVGSRVHPTRALARLDDVDGVRRFLRWLLEARNASASLLTAPPFLRAHAEPPRTSLLVVSCRVPEPADSGIREVGGLVSALEPAFVGLEGVWMGSTGQERDAPVEIRFEPDGDPPKVSFDLPPALHALYDSGFCNRVLWPLFHGLPVAGTFDVQEWNAYVAGNDLFADIARGLVRADGVVWVHDFHLLLAGAAMRRREHVGPLGLFLHAPFPPPSVLEPLPWTRELLQAMAAFDLIGFQAQRWANNYLDARRALTPDARRAVGVFPIAIDAERFHVEASAPRQPEIERLLAARSGRKLLLGVDRLDGSKGVLQRLSAYELLLERNPRWRRRVTFLQISLPAHDSMPGRVELQHLVEHMVGRINGRFGETDWVPVRYLARAYGHETLAQLYRAADVAVVTPLCDGLNLVAKEFIAAQDADAPGVLVLSRFAGAADSLSAAILTNPLYRDGLAADLDRALSMELRERRSRHDRLLEAVRETTPIRWTRGFLTALAQASASSASVSRATASS